MVTERLKALDANTMVPLGVIASVILVLISAVGYLNSKFSSIDKSQQRIERRLEKLEDISSGRWTYTDQRIWALLLQQKNPTLKVPHVGVPSSKIKKGQ